MLWLCSCGFCRSCTLSNLAVRDMLVVLRSILPSGLVWLGPRLRVELLLGSHPFVLGNHNQAHPDRERHQQN